MFVSAEEMLTKAREGKYAVGQFNINNLEWTKDHPAYSSRKQIPLLSSAFPRARASTWAGFKTVAGMASATARWT